MIYGEGVRLTGNPGRLLGGAQAHSVARGSWGRSGDLRAFANLSLAANKSSIPAGHRHPGAWMLPQKSGGLASYNTVFGAGALSTGNLAGGLNGDADLTGSGSISTAAGTMVMAATAALFGSGTVSAALNAALGAAAALAGSGNVTGSIAALTNIAAVISGSGVVSANLVAALEAIAALAGSGNLTAALNAALGATAALAGAGTLAAAITGKREAIAALVGSGDVTAAIKALAHLISALGGSGAVTASTAAKAGMAADINVTGSTLTTANVASSVWNALAASFNETGTMGNLMNAAGGAVSPQIIADAILARAIEGGADGGRTVSDALKALRNRVALVGTTLTVYEDDDVTPAWTAVVALGARNPINSVDPS